MFDEHHRCEYFMSTCDVYRVVAASGLLSRLEVVPAGYPHRGYTQWRLGLSAAVIGAVLVAVKVAAILRRRRSTTTDPTP